MEASIIARNYAETLLELARREGGEQAVDRYAEALREVNEVLGSEQRVRRFVESPLIDAEAKKSAIRASFGKRVPELFLRFLLVVVEKRREALLHEIGRAFEDLVDEARGRVRAEVVLSHEPDAGLQETIRNALERRTGMTVATQFEVDPELVGGVRIRIGDQIMDGSIRRQLVRLRRRMLEADIRQAGAAAS